MNNKKVIETLKEKYNYQEELLIMLEKIISGMIEYYGEKYQDRIINAFYDTPILYMNTKDSNVLKKETQQFEKSLGLKKYTYVPIIASGAYFEEYQLNDKQEMERITFVILKHSDDEEMKLDMFIHELCHMVMNYNNFKIIDNSAISKTGLLTEIITIRNKKEIHKNNQEGAEEAFNEYDATRIFKIVKGYEMPKEKMAYGIYVKSILPIMDNPTAANIIKNSRLNNDDSYMEILGENLTNTLFKDLGDLHNHLTGWGTKLPEGQFGKIIDELLEFYEKLPAIVNEKYPVKRNNNIK